MKSRIKPKTPPGIIPGKKGLGIGQVFIFIVVALTFALIMIFGYKAIIQFLQRAETIELVQFKTDIERSVERIYTQFGSVNIEKFKTPARYAQVCFVDMDAPYDAALCQEDPIACSVWKDSQEYASVSKNVFLQPSHEGIPEIKVHKITIASQDGKNYLCLPIVKGSFSLQLEGKGDHTELSAYLS